MCSSGIPSHKRIIWKIAPAASRGYGELRWMRRAAAGRPHEDDDCMLSGVIRDEPDPWLVIHGCAFEYKFSGTTTNVRRLDGWTDDRVLDLRTGRVLLSEMIPYSTSWRDGWMAVGIMGIVKTEICYSNICEFVYILGEWTMRTCHNQRPSEHSFTAGIKAVCRDTISLIGFT